jgi:hypothetical protein
MASSKLALALRNPFSASSLCMLAMSMDCRDDQIKLHATKIFRHNFGSLTPIFGESILIVRNIQVGF